MVSATVSNPAGDIVETYTYDYLGNRTTKTSNGVTTKFTTDLLSGYAQVLKAEKDSEVTYFTRGFELISKTTNGETVFYLYDGGSSVRALTDESGAVTDTLVFDAFGNETEKTGTTENSYGFQGEEQDSTGLYYLRARYMDPSTGTFTSMDTYGGSLTDPMSLHKYLFANSNPVKYCDPSGHFSLNETQETMVISAILSAAEYEIIWGIAWIVDMNEGTDYSSGFSVWGFLKAVGLGALFGAAGAGVESATKGLITSIEGELTQALFQYWFVLFALTFSIAFYYLGFNLYELGAPDIIVDVVFEIADLSFSVATTGTLPTSGFGEGVKTVLDEVPGMVTSAETTFG